MNNKEAIRILGLECDEWDISHCTASERRKAFEMAIDALRTQDITEVQANSERLQAVYDDGYKAGYDQARYDYGTQPDLQPTCNKLATDCISRQDAVNAIDSIDRSDGIGISSIACEKLDMAIDTINSLPSAQPEITNEEIRLALKQLRTYLLIKIRDKKDGDVPVELLQRIEEIQEYVGNLPSAQPEWEELLVICDNCGHAIHIKRLQGENDGT